MKIEITTAEAMTLYSILHNRIQSYYALAKSCKQHNFNYFANQFERDAKSCKSLLDKLGETSEQEFGTAGKSITQPRNLSWVTREKSSTVSNSYYTIESEYLQ